MTQTRVRFHWLCGVALAGLLVHLMFSPALAGEDGGLGFDPTAKVSVEWIPEPYPVVGANAAPEAEMRKYTEKIVGSDHTLTWCQSPPASSCSAVRTANRAVRPTKGRKSK